MGNRRGSRKSLLSPTFSQAKATENAAVAQSNADKAQTEQALAIARQLITQSVLAEESDPELSILFAANAVAATWPLDHAVLPEAEEQLRHAVSASHVRLTLNGHTKQVWSVAWSPDGKRLASGSHDGTARVWDAASGKELLTLNGNAGYVSSVAWSPDGKRLATGDQALTAHVWDATSGQELLTLKGHTGALESVAWSPDGKRLGTASRDGTAKVWDAVSGHELLTLEGHMAQVFSVAWSPDGKRLAIGTAHGTLQVYAMDPHLLLHLARSRVTRKPPELTPDECQRYFQSQKCPPLP